MGEEEFEAELMYRVSLSVAGLMLRESLITQENYHQIDSILLETYHPVLGTLLAGSPLSRERRP